MKSFRALPVVRSRGCSVILSGPAYLVEVLTIGASHLICPFPRTGVGSSHDENLAALLAFDFLLHGSSRKESKVRPEKHSMGPTLQPCENRVKSVECGFVSVSRPTPTC